MPNRPARLIEPRALQPMARGFLVNRRGQSLYVCLHGSRASAVVWVLCNAALEEATFATRFLVDLADALAHQGAAVVRFDYAGQGESEGDLRQLSVQDWADDVADVTAWARAQTTPVAEVQLLGLRAGCFPVLRALASSHAQRVVLIEPVLDGARYFDDALRAHLTTQLACWQRVTQPRAALREQLLAGGVVSVMGHEMGQVFAASLEACKLAEMLRLLPGAAPAPVAVQIVHLPRLAGRHLPEALGALHAPPAVTVHTGLAHQPWDAASCYWQAPAALLQDCVAVMTSALPPQASVATHEGP